MERIQYRPVPASKLCAGAGFHNPSRVHCVQMDSPAVEVMTDLQQTFVATIDPDSSLASATQVMIARRVRLLLVVEQGYGLVGLITARDTMGERPIKLVRERGGAHRELLVRDLMIPTHEIDVLAYADVSRAEVGHIVATLKDFGRQHALVVDVDAFTGQKMIRGIFSSTQIGRQLEIPLVPVEYARSFAEIGAELAT